MLYIITIVGFIITSDKTGVIKSVEWYLKCEKILLKFSVFLFLIVLTVRVSQNIVAQIITTYLIFTHSGNR